MRDLVEKSLEEEARQLPLKAGPSLVRMQTSHTYAHDQEETKHSWTLIAT